MNTKQRVTLTYVALALLFSACRTATVDPAAADIDAFVHRTLKEFPEVPSIGIAVVRGNHPVYVNEVGFRDREHQIPSDAQTGYYIASATKSFTGLACAMLAARGVIDLDAPITRYLPEVRMKAPLDPARITLRLLLTHSAGFENNAIVFRTAWSGEHTSEQLIKLLERSTPLPPGFHYDNLGYVVASLVIERVTGKRWQDVLEELIFHPLAMSHTSAYMSHAVNWPQATPYEPNRKLEVERVDLTKSDQTMHAAGGIVTTPGDLARWLSANLTEGRSASLPTAPFREAQRQQVTTQTTRDQFQAHGYGFGWYQATYDQDDVRFHLGSFTGWSTHFSFMPEKQIGVAIVANGGGPSIAVLNLIAAYTYDRMLGKSDAEAKNGERLTALKAQGAKMRERMLAEIEKRAQRPWTLQHPNANYVGRYANDAMGMLAITAIGDKLVASIGPLRSPFEPFTKAESARIELVPGSGSVLTFHFGAGDKPAAVTWQDDLFVRVE